MHAALAQLLSTARILDAVCSQKLTRCPGNAVWRAGGFWRAWSASAGGYCGIPGARPGRGLWWQAGTRDALHAPGHGPAGQGSLHAPRHGAAWHGRPHERPRHALHATRLHARHAASHAHGRYDCSHVIFACPWQVCIAAHQVKADPGLGIVFIQIPTSTS
jgi:hypothetical protein